MPLKPFSHNRTKQEQSNEHKKALRPKGNIVSKLRVDNILKLRIKPEYELHKDKAAKSHSLVIRSKNTLTPVLCRITHRQALCESVSPHGI